MTSPLLLLVLPLLAATALLPAWRGAAAARLIIACFALATLQLASGSLAIEELAAWSAQGASQAMFVSLSSGIAIGGLGLWSRRGWLWWASALPLGLALLVVFWSTLQWLPLLLGAVLGALPLLVASLLPSRARAPSRVSVADMSRSDWIVMVLALAAAASSRLVLVLLAPILPALARSRDAAHDRRHVVLPALAALILVALAAYAISLANPTVVLTSFGFEPPLVGAVERVVGAAILAAAVLMVAPWPMHRLGPGIILTPAAVFLAHRVGGTIAPLGIEGWLPLAAMLLVPSAIAAAWRGYWGTALGSVALLASQRAGWPGLGLILLVTMTLPLVSPGNPRPPDRISFPEAWYTAVLLGAGLAFTTAAVLAHEVVLGALLAAGLAAAAARPVWRPPAG